MPPPPPPVQTTNDEQLRPVCFIHMGMPLRCTSVSQHSITDWRLVPSHEVTLLAEAVPACDIKAMPAMADTVKAERKVLEAMFVMFLSCC